MKRQPKSNVPEQENQPQSKHRIEWQRWGGPHPIYWEAENNERKANYNPKMNAKESWKLTRNSTRDVRHSQQQHEQTMQERSATATDRRRRRCREALAVVGCEELDTSRECNKRTKLPALLSWACDRSPPPGPFHVYPRAQWTGDASRAQWRSVAFLPVIQRAVLKTQFTYIIQRTRLSKLFFKCILWKKKKKLKKNHQKNDFSDKMHTIAPSDFLKKKNRQKIQIKWF